MNFELIEKVGDRCSKFCYTVAQVPIFGWVIAAMCFMLYIEWILIVAVVSLVRGVYNLIFK